MRAHRCAVLGWRLARPVLLHTGEGLLHRRCATRWHMRAMRRDADARHPAAADMLPGIGPTPRENECARDRMREQLAQALVACE